MTAHAFAKSRAREGQGREQEGPGHLVAATRQGPGRGREGPGRIVGRAGNMENANPLIKNGSNIIKVALKY